MRILFVQVPTSHLGAGERVYPLGLSRLSGVVSKEHIKSSLDMNLSLDPWLELRDVVAAEQPEAVVLSFRNLDPLAGLHSSYVSSLKTAAEMVRLMSPGARILAGGPAFSLFGKRLMQEIPEIDYGLIGEGEQVFSDLFSSAFNPQSVPGLLWRNDLSVELNPVGSYTSMDTLPELDLTSFDPQDYTRGNKYVAAMGIEGKRGCDLGCAYCVYPGLSGRRLRLRSPKLIIDEMEFLHRRHGIGLFHFTDSVLNRPADHFESTCREIKSRKLEIKWTGFFREDVLTEDILELAVDAGLVAIYFSADALNDYGLKLLNKRLTKEDIFNAARITARNGVLTMCHFLVNLPGETHEHFHESRRVLDEILEIHAAKGNLGAVIFNNVRLYPGAPLTKKLVKRGDLDPRIDLLYPMYFNPPQTAHILHEFEAHCHSAGVFSRLAQALS